MIKLLVGDLMQQYTRSELRQKIMTIFVTLLQMLQMLALLGYIFIEFCITNQNLKEFEQNVINEIKKNKRKRK